MSEDSDLEDRQSLSEDEGSSKAGSTKQDSEVEQDITHVALERTIFVGNLPSKLNHKDVAKLFKTCGPVESARIRNIVPEKEKLSRKVALITKRIHPKVDSVNAYVVFANTGDDECIKKALAMNGAVIDGHHIRVDRAQQPNSKRLTLTSRKKSVFVGNLRFDLRDDDLIKHFEKVGSIDYVRLVRDRATGMGKGFGFVKFMERASVKKALELNDTDFKGRKLRVKKIDEKMKLGDDAKKPKKGNRERPQKNNQTEKSPNRDGGDDSGFIQRKKLKDSKKKNSDQFKQKDADDSKQGSSERPKQNSSGGNLKKFDKTKPNGKLDKEKKRVKFDLKNIKSSNDQHKREGPQFSKVRVNKMNKKKAKTILKKKVKKEFMKG